MVKNLPAMQETQVWSLGLEDPLEKGMATHSSILAWEVPWAEEPGGLQSMGSQRVRHDWVYEQTATGQIYPLKLGVKKLIVSSLMLNSYKNDLAFSLLNFLKKY